MGRSGEKTPQIIAATPTGGGGSKRVGWAPPWRIHGGSPPPMGDSPRRFYALNRARPFQKHHPEIDSENTWGRGE